MVLERFRTNLERVLLNWKQIPFKCAFEAKPRGRVFSIQSVRKLL